MSDEYYCQSCKCDDEDGCRCDIDRNMLRYFDFDYGVMNTFEEFIESRVAAVLAERNELMRKEQTLVEHAPELLQMLVEAVDLLDGDLTGSAWKSACYALKGKVADLVMKINGEEK